MALRKKSVAEAPVTSVLGDDQLPTYDRELTADEEVLVALGYKPEFKREFSLWTTFCVSFAVLGLLPSFASTLYYVCPLFAIRSTGAYMEKVRDSLNCDVRAWAMQEQLEWSGDG